MLEGSLTRFARACCDTCLLRRVIDGRQRLNYDKSCLRMSSLPANLMMIPFRDKSNNVNASRSKGTLGREVGRKKKVSTWAPEWLNGRLIKLGHTLGRNQGLSRYGRSRPARASPNTRSSRCSKLQSVLAYHLHHQDDASRTRRGREWCLYRSADKSTHALILPDRVRKPSPESRVRSVRITNQRISRRSTVISVNPSNISA